MSRLSYYTLADLCDRKIGIHDVACPLCGPDRRSPVNRKRRVLRIWYREPGFATYVCARCGAKGWARADGVEIQTHQSAWRLTPTNDNQRHDYAKRQLAKARRLWSRGERAQDSFVEAYLRHVRAYSGPLPSSIRSLEPLRPEHHPAMIAAFALADEPEPGLFSIQDDQVCGVHLTLLKPDGSDKAGTSRDRLMVGRSSGWPIVLAPLNDTLGLVICEGIETGLSLYEATGCGVWAAGSGARMPALADTVPCYVDCVTIAGEDDDGRNGAIELASRLEARGLYCELRFLDAEEARAA